MSQVLEIDPTNVVINYSFNISWSVFGSGIAAFALVKEIAEIAKKQFYKRNPHNSLRDLF